MGRPRANLVAPSDRRTYLGETCRVHISRVRYKKTGHCVSCVEAFTHPHTFRTEAIRIAPDGVTPPSIGLALLAAQGNRCAACGASGTEARLALDHIVSLLAGGDHWPRNRQWLCQPCNSNKWCHSQTEWRNRRGIPLRTPWDAPAHIVARLDKVARDADLRQEFVARAKRLRGDGDLILRLLLTMRGRKSSVARRFDRREVRPGGWSPAADVTWLLAP